MIQNHIFMFVYFYFLYNKFYKIEVEIYPKLTMFQYK